MSTVTIRAALEKAVKAAFAGQTFITENAPQDTDASGAPTLQPPFVALAVEFMPPLYNEVGSEHWTERGMVQLVGNFPLSNGWGAAQAFVDQVRAAFPPGSTLTTTDGQTVQIAAPADPPRAMRDGNGWSQPVTVPFFSNV